MYTEEKATQDRNIFKAICSELKSNIGARIADGDEKAAASKKVDEIEKLCVGSVEDRLKSAKKAIKDS